MSLSVTLTTGLWKRSDQVWGQDVWKGSQRMLSCWTQKVWEHNASHHQMTVRWTSKTLQSSLFYVSNFFFPKSKEMLLLQPLQIKTPSSWRLALAHLFLNYTLATDSSLASFQNHFSTFQHDTLDNRSHTEGSGKGVTYPNEEFAPFLKYTRVADGSALIYMQSLNHNQISPTSTHVKIH